MALRRTRDAEAEPAQKAKPAKKEKEKKQKQKPKKKKQPVAKAEPPPPAPFSMRAALQQQLQAAQDAHYSHDGAGAVHGARIALKRIRVLARIADHAAPEGGAALEFAAQAAMRRLAPARDLAAIEQAARTVCKRAKGADRVFLLRVVNDISRTRVAAEAAALGETSIAMLRLAPIVDAVPEIQPPDIKRAASHLVRRARAAYKDARGSRSVLRRHAWRKREKDRRYGALLLAHAWPRKAHADLESKLTEALGRERDAGLLLAKLGANAHTPKGVVKLVKAYRRERARRADKLGARLYGK